MRTRVSRARRNKEKWCWWIFDGDLSDSCDGFDSEAEARADLDRALTERGRFVQLYEDNRTFMRDAFGESGGKR